MLKYSRKIFLFLFCVQMFLPVLAFAQAKEPWKGAYTTEAFAGGAVRGVYCDLVGEMENSFGALQFIVGGITAFGYAVFGNPKKAYSIIAAGIVAATMSTGVSLSFGEMCGGQSSANAARLKEVALDVTEVPDNNDSKADKADVGDEEVDSSDSVF